MEIDSDIFDRLELIERRDKIAEAKGSEARRLMAMPFHLRIQEEGQEIHLEEVYDIQKHSFENICKKDKIHKDDWKDEFAMFWIGFLKGEYKSINQYLKRKNYVK